MRKEAIRIAMMSMHSSPMGELGTRDTGGMSVYIEEVARRLAAKGHVIDIFTRSQHPVDPKVIRPFHNVRVIHLKAGPHEPLTHSILHRHLGEFWNNLDHFKNSEGARYDLLHSHYFLSGQIGRWAQKHWKIPHVFMFHTLGILKNQAVGAQEAQDLRIASERHLAEECDLILATTEREKRHLVELYGATPQRIHVVPCGVDLESFKPAEQRESRARLNIRETGPVILYVGRFDSIKGVDRLLTAASMLRHTVPLQVILVGGGGEDAPEDRVLHALCSELSMEDCVTFAGRKRHDELPDFYRAADVVVLPSHYESFGLVVLEALACGTPVVATRVGIVEDIVLNGVNGWVASDNSPEDLAEGIKRVLDFQNSGSAVADSIRATILDYDWNFVAGSLDSEYKMLLGSIANLRNTCLAETGI